MNQNRKIAVLGGGGRTGKYLITKLIDKGYFVKIQDISLTDIASINTDVLVINQRH